MTEATAERREPSNAHDYKKYQEYVHPFMNEKIFHPLVFDEQSYDIITAQPSVIMEGDVPVVLAVDDAPMLAEPDRCRRMAGELGVEDGRNVYASALPPEALIENLPFLIERLSQTSEDKVIFTEIDITDDESELRFQKSLLPFGVTMHQLEHPQLHSRAAYNFFELNVSPKTDAEQAKLTAAEVIAGGQMPVIETDDERIEIARGDKLDEETLDQLWELFSSRFTDISDNLPMSLEESEENTRALMTDPRYNFIFKRDERGKVIACLFFSDEAEAYPWINPDFISGREAALREKEDEEPYSVFIPGVAAERSGRGSRAAGEVLGQLTEVLARTNRPRISVRFECTDVSSRYVPAISMRAARQQPLFEARSIEQIGQMRFVALKVPAQATAGE